MKLLTENEPLIKDKVYLTYIRGESGHSITHLFKYIGICRDNNLHALLLYRYSGLNIPNFKTPLHMKRCFHKPTSEIFYELSEQEEIEYMIFNHV